MNEKLKEFLESLGLITIEEHPQPFDYNCEDYDLIGSNQKEKIQAHKEFLISALQEENNRLNYVENKTTQIISQTSIVFSLVGLIIPIVIDRFDDMYFPVRVILILLLIGGFFMYLLSISNALKNFNIKNFKYPYANPSNVIDLKDKSIEEFNSELVRDYLYSINKTVHINNVKGSNLLHAYKAFKIANYITGIIIVVICFLILFIKQKENINRVKIENPIEIKQTKSKIIPVK
ncbi:hypothetical protein HZP85_14405 [Elizabethkingia anophelis]|uniref:hypothetical protein n=1 Tax=Chryseobacterium sp. PCH239 TaxID=2825845 RepID=UPI001C0FDBE2|nr:hypothetical protein [Chryseobacterium sp. PCH239]MCT4073852.1 hypothetical protein [Elizabethkingia anophelis]QWT86112.1 hypothetical protein KBP46_22235 [Chryseobacterium sp. PCH239]